VDEQEYRNVYVIPANYTDSGRLMGGMLETRNTIEAIALVLLAGYLELTWLGAPGITKVVIMTVTLMPLGVFALMGIGGDSLLQFTSHMVMFWLRRRKLHFRRIGYRYGNAKNKIKGPKRKKTPQKRRKRIEFVQDYIPVRNIRNGIIETTDGRYIKILEIEPINFLLRSAEEQHNIIATFAAWLKISPMKLQFKSITRKADADKHVAALRDELKAEENPQCRHLGEEYVRLLKDVGSREALTRRFFLIFEYEPPAGRRQMNPDYGEVYGTIQGVVQTAKSYFAQCGNAVVQPDDEDAFAAEILYVFFNRKSCAEEPFQSRMERVVVDTMAAKDRVLGVDPVPNIRTAHFIAPRGIDFTNHNYVIMDGVYFAFLYVRKDGYPNTVQGGWMSALINAGEGVDIDVFLRRETRSKTLDRVAQRIRLNRTKFREMQDTSTDFEELANSIQAGYYIKNGISNHNEDLFYLLTFITLSARSLDELEWRKQQVVDMLKAMDIVTGDCNFQQEAALKSVMPFLSIAPDLARKAQRNILTSGAASTYMFTSFELSDEHGILLGINRHNNSLCIVDLFNTKINKNANVTILGTSGAGKTFLMQTMALRMRMRGIQCYILAPLKGHEFKRACKAIGGEYIKISPGSGDCINVMEIRQTTTPEMELIDEIDYSGAGSLLARKIQQLLIFFSLLIPDMTNEEEQMLDEALIKTYAEFGIGYDNDSLYQQPGVMKPMPILGDIHRHLEANPLTRRVATIVGRFVTGSAQSFNQQTNVNLTNKYVVLDISELKGRLLPVGMMIALDFVWDSVKADRTLRKAVYTDEIWQLMGAGSNRQAAEFCLEIKKIIRGYGGAAIDATQDIGDYFGLEDGKYGRAMLNNSKTKIVLNLEPDEARHVQEVLKLTRTEVRSITQFERGEALVSSNSNKVPVIIKTSKAEAQMITTDRAELAELLQKKKKHSTTQANQANQVKPNNNSCQINSE